MVKQKRCPNGMNRFKGECIIKKGEIVGIKGDSSVGMSGWEGKILKYTGKGYYLIKSKDNKEIDEIHRREIITNDENNSFSKYINTKKFQKSRGKSKTNPWGNGR